MVVRQSMKEQFEQAPDWRAFVFAARRSPAEGGQYYALRALSLCGRDVKALVDRARRSVSVEIARTGTTTADRLRFVESLETRCAGFAQGEVASLYKELAEEGKGGNDPWLNARDKVLRATQGSDATAVRDAAARLLALHDGDLLTDGDLLLRLMSFGAPGVAKGSLWFGGDEYRVDDALRQAEIRMAVDLAGCQLSKTCALLDRMSIGCMFATQCDLDPERYLKSGYLSGGGTADSFERAVALSRRIGASIERQAVGDFVRPVP